MQCRSVTTILIGLLSTALAFAQSEKPSETTIRLEKFGFRSGTCSNRSGVQFLDDDHLLLSAALVAVCDKSNWNNAVDTQLTVIDLRGTAVVTKTQPDVFKIKEGPIGYATVCTDKSVELLSKNLENGRVISDTPGRLRPCYDVDGISPSRTAISILKFDEDPKAGVVHRLFKADVKDPIAELHTHKGVSLAAISDAGYAVCSAGANFGCEHLTVEERSWATGFADGAYRPGVLLDSDLLLIPGQLNDKFLYALRPDGIKEKVVDLHGISPPNAGSVDYQISATVPRRVLYSVTGCYIGDFDDCYGLAFKRFALLDPSTHQVLLKENAGRGAVSVLSPNGRTLAILDRAVLHIYIVP